MTRRDGWRIRARSLQRDVRALYLAARDPRVPWYAKAVALVVVAYALSPLDLIPDFIPVLGYVDDLLLVPLGMLLAVRLVPARLMAEFRAVAADADRGGTLGRVGAGFVVVLWVTALLALGFWVRSYPGAVNP